MQETWKFGDIDFGQVGDPPTAEGFSRLIGDRSREMGIFLSYYYRSERAVVENVSLTSLQVCSPQVGRLLVRFSLVYFNACLNIHEEGHETMELGYQAVPEKNELILTGPFWPEREPDGW
jgi:hypothetical protein